MLDWDYISIGTVGFAQVGNPEYHRYNEIEKQVIGTYYRANTELNVPDEFSLIARFKWQICPHDIHDYSDFVIYYNRTLLDELEEDDYSKWLRFYDWVNLCESAIADNDEVIMDLCKKVYRENIPMEVIYKSVEETFEGLKKVE
jgi:hypothetical protein